MYARSVVFLLLLGGALLCAAQELSLGDLARQHKAGDRPRARRVVTDENLPHASPSEAMNGAVVSPKSAEQGAAQASPAKAADAKPATPGDAQKRIDELKGIEDAAQRSIKKFEEELKDENISLERRELFEEGLRTAKQLQLEAMTERGKIEESVTPAQAQSNAGNTDAKSAPENAAKDKGGDEALASNKSNSDTKGAEEEKKESPQAP